MPDIRALARCGASRRLSWRNRGFGPVGDLAEDLGARLAELIAALVEFGAQAAERAAVVGHGVRGLEPGRVSPLGRAAGVRSSIQLLEDRVLSFIETESVHVVVTSPPYALLKDYPDRLGTAHHGTRVRGLVATVGGVPSRATAGASG